MLKPLRLLCVDDEVSILAAYKRIFRDAERFDVTLLNEPQDYDLQQALDFDVIICDQRMPGISGTQFFAELAHLGFQGRKIICSGFTDFDDMANAFNQRHIDYFLNKPWDNNEIVALVEGALHQGDTEDVKIPVNRNNSRIEKAYQLADKAALTDISVYIQGETGTGKEVITRYIHKHSARNKGPFITVNCATLTTDLFESLMFGHKKGAFTGAINDHVGFYQAADGGTLFLDEVVDIPAAAQAKILRALQENTITRLGDTKNIEVDVRVISASAKSIADAVQEGKFREDLMYRLNVFPISIPPLRERRDEIETLFRHFIQKFNFHPEWKEITLEASALDLILSYPWPGNIRELENVCNFICATIETNAVRNVDFPEHIARYSFSGNNVTAMKRPAMSLQEAMQISGNNKTKAAELLGISRMTLWRRLQEHDA